MRFFAESEEIAEFSIFVRLTEVSGSRPGDPAGHIDKRQGVVGE